MGDARSGRGGAGIWTGDVGRGGGHRPVRLPSLWCSPPAGAASARSSRPPRGRASPPPPVLRAFRPTRGGRRFGDVGGLRPGLSDHGRQRGAHSHQPRSAPGPSFRPHGRGIERGRSPSGLGPAGPRLRNIPRYVGPSCQAGARAEVAAVSRAVAPPTAAKTKKMRWRRLPAGPRARGRAPHGAYAQPPSISPISPRDPPTSRAMTPIVT